MRKTAEPKAVATKQQMILQSLNGSPLQLLMNISEVFVSQRQNKMTNVSEGDISSYIGPNERP